MCALILAAGAGTRLRPITATIPKALCPVGNVALLDRALDRLAQHGLAGPGLVAVNACYLADAVRTHVAGRAHVSDEPGPTALGTAGAVGHLRDWIGGRAVLVGNADAYLAPAGDPARDLAALLAGWSGETVRILCVPADADHPAEFGSCRFAGFSLLPPATAARLPPTHAELVHTVWRPAERAGRLELIRYGGRYLDTGTVADYLAANLHAAGAGCLIAADATVCGPVDRAVIGSRAVVLGAVTRAVVLPDGFVGAAERLVDAVRVGRTTTAYPLPTPAP